jgi:hypothetical protein
METRTLRAYGILVGLMVLTSLALAFTVDVTTTDQAGIKVYLPDQVGVWNGRELRFCQNYECHKQFTTDQLADRDHCPNCGSELAGATREERDLLPPDTVLFRKVYENGAGNRLFTTIVLSGSERASIHRPQICLEGQGNRITADQVISVPIPGREPLDVMVLDLHESRRLPDGRLAEGFSYFAYWFVGKGRETPYHTQRMVWMATDRIFHNVSHRWAYISISGTRQDGMDRYKKEVSDFVSELYPNMALEGEG